MKRGIRLLVFIILVFSILLVIDLKLKPYNESIDTYQEKYSNSDVVVFGSSHAFCNLNGPTLFDEFGIASVCVGQPEQPICMTYYQMEETFRKEHPKIAIVEVYMAIVSDEYNESQMNSHYTKAILSYPIWENFDIRLEASKFIKKSKVSFILGLPVYHNEYDNYFSHGKSTTAGYFYLAGQDYDGQFTEQFSTCDINDIDLKSIDATSEEYLLKMKSLCEENDVELLFILTPYQATMENMQKHAYVEKIAKENGISIIDMNNYVADMNFDYSTDMYNWGHTNIEGNVKSTRWLGNYLVLHYDLPDRREDPNFQVWEEIEKISEVY